MIEPLSMMFDGLTRYATSGFLNQAADERGKSIHCDANRQTKIFRMSH
jgi:hypothetical protein